MTNPVYRTPAWRKASRATIARDQNQCMIRMVGCLQVATTADHIVELADGGEPYEMSNLQAACRPCNTRKRNLSKRRRRARGRVRLQAW